VELEVAIPPAAACLAGVALSISHISRHHRGAPRRGALHAELGIVAAGTLVGDKSE
jgi:hypothetical protein